MSIITLSILLGLASAFFGAISNVAAKYVLSFTNTKDYISLNFALLFIILLPFAPFFFFLVPTLSTFLVILAASLVDGIANYLFFKSFEKGDAVTASALLSLSPFFSLLIAPLWNSSQSLTPAGVIGIVVIVLGIVTLNREEQLSVSNHPGVLGISKKWFLIPLVASFLFGANIYLIKYLFAENLTNPYTYYFVRALIIAIMMFFLLKPQIKWVDRKRLQIVTGRAIIVAIQWMLLLYALDFGNPPVIKAVSDTSPLFVIFLSAVFLRGRVTVYRFIGSLIIVVGLILITI